MKKTKKTNQVTLLIAIISMLLLSLTSFSVYAEETAPKKEKGAYEAESYENTILLEDISASMKKTFKEEVKKIQIDREAYMLYRTFEPGERTNLYGELNRACSEGNSVSVITDLWDTADDSLEEWSGKDLRIYVPFVSTDEKAVEHVENVVFNQIEPHFKDSFVSIIYLDTEEVVLLQSTTAILLDKQREKESAESAEVAEVAEVAESAESAEVAEAAESAEVAEAAEVAEVAKDKTNWLIEFIKVFIECTAPIVVLVLGGSYLILKIWDPILRIRSIRDLLCCDLIVIDTEKDISWSWLFYKIINKKIKNITVNEKTVVEAVTIVVIADTTITKEHFKIVKKVTVISPDLVSVHEVFEH